MKLPQVGLRHASIRSAMRYVRVTDTTPQTIYLAAGEYSVCVTPLDYSILTYRVVVQEDTSHPFDPTATDHACAGFTVSTHESVVMRVEENQAVRVVGIGNATYPHVVFFERISRESL